MIVIILQQIVKNVLTSTEMPGNGNSDAGG
jgi:hypothetical protein